VRFVLVVLVLVLVVVVAAAVVVVILCCCSSTVWFEYRVFGPLYRIFVSIRGVDGDGV
jgi:hypothetical protein